MTSFEYAEILQSWHAGARNGRKVMTVMLFGIKYGHELKAKKLHASRIADLAGLSSSASALSMGISLSEYVRLEEI